MSTTSSYQGRPTGGKTSSAADCWVFDVDGCLVDSLTGTSLRPGARELLDSLAGRSQVLLWSAGGDTYARARAEQFQVDHLVNGYFSKEGRDDEGRYLTAHLPLGPRHVVFVDDRPEDLDDRLDVIAVSPYLSDDPHDRGLRAVARRAGLPPSAGG
jgi:long-chain acyl-CoA synthetase